jgi:hypothetical protein
MFNALQAIPLSKPIQISAFLSIRFNPSFPDNFLP